MTTTLQLFESSLADVGLEVTRVTPEAFADRVDETIESPAVGTPLAAAFDEPTVSLTETAVEVDPTPAALRDATTGVTGAHLGIANYGSVVLAPTDRTGELVSLFVDRHVAVVRAADVVSDMDAAVDAIDDEIGRTRGSAIIATGPSATADMGALVKGAHGPRDIHVLVVVEGI